MASKEGGSFFCSGLKKGELNYTEILRQGSLEAKCKIVVILGWHIVLIGYWFSSWRCHQLWVIEERHLVTIFFTPTRVRKIMLFFALVFCLARAVIFRMQKKKKKENSWETDNFVVKCDERGMRNQFLSFSLWGHILEHQECVTLSGNIGQ